MSTTSGTASNYQDLLVRLRDFLCNQGHAWGVAFTGTGTGRLTAMLGASGSVVQTITCTASSSTSFSVVGSVSGSLGTATVGSAFTSAQCGFTITAGATAFVAGDVFTFNLSPKWTLLRWGGCSDSALRTSSVSGASALFDGTTSSNAISAASTSLPITITVQMQAATQILSFSLWNGNSATLAPTAFGLQYSDDGTTWTTAQSWSAQTWSGTYTRKDYALSSAPGAHLYWRLNITAGGSTINVAELRLHADANYKWAASHGFEFAFRGPGVDGAQQIHVLGSTVVNSGTGYWNAVFRGVRFWTDQELSVGDVPNATSTHAHLLNNNAIAYWIVANGGRFMLMTRISGVYELTYCGFGLPYETPTNHPYPCIIGAPSNSTTRLVSEATDAAYRNPYDPGNLGMEVCIPSGQWREVRNRATGTGTEGGTGGAAYGKTWPYSTDETGSQSISSTLRDAIDGTKPVLPCVITLPADVHPWGEFDGIAWTSGYNNSAEALVRIGALDWIAFPNVFRSGNNFFAAIALD